MIKLKKLCLKNYCGYRDIVLDFTDEDRSKSIVCFYGPNGVGKSNILKSIATISNAYRYHGRNMFTYFRKLIYSEDYNPSYAEFVNEKTKDMELTGVYETDDGDKKVVIGVTETIEETVSRFIEVAPDDIQTIQKTIKKNIMGVKLNELPKKVSMSYHYLIDADHPNNMYKFQLHSKMKDVFLDFAEAVYGMKCHLNSDVSNLGDESNMEGVFTKEETESFDIEDFYTDFVIEKYGTKVHFKRMSDGEKKIATLLRDLCNPLYMRDNDIILIDNVCMHIYKDRHATLINKMKEHFPDKQFFLTTHSPVLVGMSDKKLNIHISPYLDREVLYNLESYKRKEMRDLSVQEHTDNARHITSEWTEAERNALGTPKEPKLE
jgi:predicted ATP-binding protein involved in virulence